MNKILKKYILFLAVIIVSSLSVQNVNAQETIAIFQADTTKMIPDYLRVITISNPTENAITIKLSPDKKRWTNIAYKNLETKMFAISKVDSILYCKIETAGNKKSKRILYKRKKYIMFWDERFKKWDIKEKKQ